MENILVTNIGKARCVAGPGAAELLGRELERLGVRRPLLVSDAGVAALPKYEKTLSQLKAAGLDAEPKKAPPDYAFTQQEPQYETAVFILWVRSLPS